MKTSSIWLKKISKISLVSVLTLSLILSFASVGVAEAQSFTTTGTTQSFSQGSYQQYPTYVDPTFGYPSNTCINLSYNLGYGSRGGEVTKLQSFLISKGYLNFVVTGFYGSMTVSAVQRFQADNGLSAVGNVGPLTRARIQQLSCGGLIYPPPISGTPIITSITPSYGAIGTTVTLYGSGFTSNNTINFGSGTVSNSVASYNGTTLTFVVPSYMGPNCPQNYQCPLYAMQVSPGSYPVSVQNQYGTSNAVTFNVTSGGIIDPGNNYTPTISGIDAPSNLSVGQSGVWTVRAVDRTGGGLKYSVTWGDENTYYYGTVAAPYYQNNFVQSSTFTHAYNTPGVYTATFTVQGSNGYTAQSSVTVNVGYQNQNTNVPVINSISPSSGPYGTEVIIYGRNFSGYGNSVNYAGVNYAVTGLSSNDGTTLRFTVPSTPCGQYPNTGICAQVILQPGSYPISVTNSYGTSNTVYYNLTSGSGSNNVNQYITLSLNQTGNIGNFRVTPRTIIEDSRCPVGVNCIQAGRVVVSTQLQSYDMLTEYQLQYGASASATETTFDGYRVSITNVQPLRYQGSIINNSDYRITYHIVK